jgi:hypothetical protein
MGHAQPKGNLALGQAGLLSSKNNLDKTPA